MQNAISTQTVSFHDTQLITFKQDDVIYTAVRPIVEAMGLEWSGQVKKLSNPKFNCVHIYTVAQDGKNRETLCMPLRKLNGWLFSINPEKVRADLKEKVTQYQEECFEVLFNYWNKGVAINPRRHTISVEQQSAIRQAISKRCKSESVHYATIYEALKKRFDIPRYTELLACDFDEALALIESIELNVPQITHNPNQSFLTQKDVLTLAKVMDYARQYAEFAEQIGSKQGRIEVATLYNHNSADDDDGFFVCYRPRYKDDIDNAMTLFRNIAQNSLLPEVA